MAKRIPRIWTIGHSTHALADFLGLLAAHRIQTLADVRRFPASRKFPHFNQPALSRSLERAGIHYAHFPELGGRRQPRADSPNTAWRNRSFRGYADYMETAAFQVGMATLMKLAARKRTAIMCAEAVWWRCHRALLADFLESRGIEVLHIMGLRAATRHPYTSAATLRDGVLSYAQL
jgi:uncharacterized protein (DUF488 family)